MRKDTFKTESIAEFLARGGKIEKADPRARKSSSFKKAAEKADLKDMDLSALPVALKIKYGIKK